MRRTLIGLLVGPLLLASLAEANDDSTTTLTSAITTAASTLAVPEAAVSIDPAPRNEKPQRPLVLPPLYVGAVFLQGVDAHTTLAVLNHGGTEMNPLMTEVSKRPIAFIGLKTGLTVMSIVAAERMWKNDHRLGAVLTMVAFNGYMAIVAAHNVAVLRRLQAQ